MSEITTRPRRRRRVLTAVLLGTVLAGSAATANAYLRNNVEDPITIGCYATADPDGSLAGLNSDGTDPVAQCAAIWQDGSFGNPPGEVPPLVACESRGAVAVLPTSASCEELGLEAPSEGYAEANRAMHELQQSLDRVLPHRGCVSPADAVAVIERVLAEHDVTGWTVETIEVGAGQPCSSASLDPAHEKVFVHGRPTAADERRETAAWETIATALQDECLDRAAAEALVRAELDPFYDEIEFFDDTGTEFGDAEQRDAAARGCVQTGAYQLTADSSTVTVGLVG